MTVKWERFAGSTDTFAIRMAFMPDPDEGTASTSEESASWGSFQIWIGGQNLCAHIDQGEILSSCHWYTLPLLEWLVSNWNPILHEEKLPNRNVAGSAATELSMTRDAPILASEEEAIAWEEEHYGWRVRHAIRAARAGGLFPNIVIRRLRDSVEISWNDETVTGTPAGFRYIAARGVARIDPGQAAAVFFEIVDSAARYLDNVIPGSARITALKEKIVDLRSRQQHAGRLDLLAGLRELPPLTSQTHEYVREQEMQMHSRWLEIVAALEEPGRPAAAQAALAVEESDLVITGSCHAALLFSSMSPTVTKQDVQTLASILVDRYDQSGSGVDKIIPVSNNTYLSPTGRAWEEGYDLADQTLAGLDFDFTNDWVDIAEILENLKITVLTRQLEDRNIRACSFAGPHHAPTIIHNQSSSFYHSPNAQRFNLAHELCHILFDRTKGRKLAIASGPWAPKSIEQRANAFAAMFLMPAELVQHAVADSPEPITNLYGISTVASRLRVSRRTVVEHLYNLTLMTESDRDDLLVQVQENRSISSNGSP
jgi:Zn-dependent peptidase ImmA (M78 family)